MRYKVGDKILLNAAALTQITNEPINCDCVRGVWATIEGVSSSFYSVAIRNTRWSIEKKKLEALAIYSHELESYYFLVGNHGGMCEHLSFEEYNKIKPMPYSTADSILTPRHFINLIGEHEFLTLNIKS